jgi:hypothetical protein
MNVRMAWFRFIAATALIGIPSYAAAQLPSSFQTPGSKSKATEAQVCAADF